MWHKVMMIIVMIGYLSWNGKAIAGFDETFREVDCRIFEFSNNKELKLFENKISIYLDVNKTRENCQGKIDNIESHLKDQISIIEYGQIYSDIVVEFRKDNISNKAITESLNSLSLHNNCKSDELIADVYTSILLQNLMKNNNKFLTFIEELLLNRSLACSTALDKILVARVFHSYDFGINYNLERRKFFKEVLMRNVKEERVFFINILAKINAILYPNRIGTTVKIYEKAMRLGSVRAALELEKINYAGKKSSESVSKYTDTIHRFFDYHIRKIRESHLHDADMEFKNSDLLLIENLMQDW